MNSKNTGGSGKQFRLIIVYLLILALTAGILPGFAKPVYAKDDIPPAAEKAGDVIILEEEENETSEGTDLVDGSYVLSAEGAAPPELESYPDDVYGKEENMPFLLSEQNELAMIYGMSGSSRDVTTVYDTFDLDRKDITSTNAYVNCINAANAQYSENLMTSPCSNWDAVQSIGFDADGEGRKRYIASVGFNSKTITLNIQNTASSVSNSYQIGNASEAWEAPFWLMDNYVAITAGDYDGDGKETVIVYYCGNGSDVKLVEFYPTGSNPAGNWRSRDIFSIYSVLPQYENKTAYKYKPAVSLATGDFNGDGRDQLAYSAGYFNTASSATYGYENYSCNNLEQFATCVGIGNCVSSGWSFIDPFRMYELRTSDMLVSGGKYTYPLDIMHGGAIAAGDVDNNGRDEIVVAGYMSHNKDQSTSNYATATFSGDVLRGGQLEKVDNVYDFSQSFICSVISRAGNGYTKSPLKTFDMSTVQAYTWKKYCSDDDHVFVKPSMACGKTNGDNHREDVFISGIIYDFKDYSPKVTYTPAFLNSDYVKMFLPGIFGAPSVNWIRNVAVGNFNENDAGREQFIFSFFQKKHDKNQYYAKLGVITGADFNDQHKNNDPNAEIISYGEPQRYACNLRDDEVVWGNTSDVFTGSEADGSLVLFNCSSSDHPNAVPVAVDSDSDGLVGRFAKHGYVYTDPEVMAVLEAAPYFYELERANGYNGKGETTYTLSTGYGTNDTESDNVHFEVGFAGEMTAVHLKVSLELGYTMDWTSSYEESYMTTKSSEFTVQGQSAVVLQRIPVLIYTYDIWDPAHNKWIENGMNIRVPLSPRYYCLGIDEYNDFVDEYNAYLEKDSEFALIKINYGQDLPSDHEGNPDNYWTNWTQAGHGQKQLTDDIYNLDYHGTAKRFSYSYEETITEGTETSHGFHYGLTVQGGSSFAGGAGEFWAGGYTNLDYSHSDGHYDIDVNTTEISGQVQDIAAGSVQGLTYSQVVDGYGFGWSFGKWTRVLTTAGDEVPFYGYILDGTGGVRRRALPPNLSAGNEIVPEGYEPFILQDFSYDIRSDLTITKLSGDDKIYFDRSDRRIKVAGGLTQGTHKASFKISNGLVESDTIYQCTIKVTEDNTANWEGRGIPSDPYVITDATGWSALDEFMGSGYSTEGVYFELGADIQVTDTVGSQNIPFEGVFDGAGHTLKVTLQADASETGLAPFRKINNAEISHLKVTGSVSGGRHCSGLVAAASGTCLIKDCLVNVAVAAYEPNGSASYCGGILGHGYSSATTIEGCVFAGSITGASVNAGGIWGWSDNGAVPVIINCMERGTAYNDAALNPVGLGNPRNGAGVENTYYTTDLIGNPGRNWTKYGKKAYSVTSGKNIALHFGNETVYETSGLTAYDTGLAYGGTFYAGKDDVISITLADPVDEAMIYVASAGDLTGEGTEYTLVMPAENVTVSKVDDPAVTQVAENLAQLPAIEASLDELCAQLASGTLTEDAIDGIITALDEKCHILADTLAAYTDLRDDQKALFFTAQIEKAEELKQQAEDAMVLAEELIAPARALTVSKQIGDLSVPTAEDLSNEEALRAALEAYANASSAYNSLTDEQKALVPGAANEKLQAMNLYLFYWSDEIGEAQLDPDSVSNALQALNSVRDNSNLLSVVYQVMRDKDDYTAEEVADAFNTLNGLYETFLEAENAYSALSYPMIKKILDEGSEDLLYDVFDIFARRLARAAYYYYDLDETEPPADKVANAGRIYERLSSANSTIVNHLDDASDIDEAHMLFSSAAGRISIAKRDLSLCDLETFALFRDDNRNLAVFGNGADAANLFLENDIRLAGKYYDIQTTISTTYLTALTNSDKALEFVNAVSALPAVTALTLDDEAGVTAAANLYNALTNEQKALVEQKYTDALTAAQAEINALKNGQTDISGANITVADQTFTGIAAQPEPVVSIGRVILTKDVDYTVSYKDNLVPGDATVIVTGIRKYYGSASKGFRIINDGSITCTVLFKDGYGDVLKKEIVEYGGAAHAPETPVRDDGMIFTGWDKPYDFITGLTIVTAQWKKNTTSINKAKVVLSKTEYTYNAKVQKPAIKTIGGKTLKSGTDYTAKWSSDSPKNPGRYTVTITGKGKYTGKTSASFMICFKDVPMSHSYANAVYWGLENDIASGYTGSKTGTFGINDDITRGQVMMFLWRAAGKPNPKKTTQTFKDVPTSSNFFKAIQWGVEKGITGGYSGARKGEFGPGDNCTRGQIAMFLWRFANKPKPASGGKSFKDVPKSNNFYEAVMWASGAKITAGYSDGTFGVNKACTRGNCVVFLYRLR